MKLSIILEQSFYFMPLIFFIGSKTLIDDFNLLVYTQCSIVIKTSSEIRLVAFVLQPSLPGTMILGEAVGPLH